MKVNSWWRWRWKIVESHYQLMMMPSREPLLRMKFNFNFFKSWLEWEWGALFGWRRTCARNFGWFFLIKKSLEHEFLSLFELCETTSTAKMRGRWWKLWKTQTYFCCIHSNNAEKFSCYRHCHITVACCSIWLRFVIIWIEKKEGQKKLFQFSS